MPEAIADTSPLVFLSKIDAVDLFEALFDMVWIPEAVRAELKQGEESGHKSIPIEEREWARLASPASLPSEWLALDLGPGELAAMSLALEHPERIVLLDDMLARRGAEGVGDAAYSTGVETNRAPSGDRPEGRSAGRRGHVDLWRAPPADPAAGWRSREGRLRTDHRSSR